MSIRIKEHIFSEQLQVTKAERQALKNQNSFVLWFTGLSGSGKSTIAKHLHQLLTTEGVHSYMLDGDNIRLGINSDLDFTDEGREENIRRISEISKLFIDAGEIVISSFISPFIADREQARKIIGEENFIEVFINTPLEVCEQRDVKGLYKKARSGEINNFTGIDSLYEQPSRPDIEVFTTESNVPDCVNHIYQTIKSRIRFE